MVAVNSCKQCGSTQFTNFHETGEVICENCGSVAEESRIVSEVTFCETGAGKAIVPGQYISHDQTGVLGNSLYGVQSGESRHQTIEKARRRLEQIGHGLQIPEHVVEASLRHFRTALTNNFVKGRKSQHVLCACLYLACRQNKTDHMLMDFAEAINVNVFYIGATYLQLIRNQKIRELPIVDPTVYIQRFAAKLQFGNDMGRKVVNDARLLVQRMSKDWLQQGRRPAGIAAACILLAARMNNFRRSKSEIVQVAKIAEETLQRRLDEFGKSRAGTLTIRDFRVTDIEAADDPPSFRKHREKERLLQESRNAAFLDRQLHSISAGSSGYDETVEPDTIASPAESQRGGIEEIRRRLTETIGEHQARNEPAYRDETGLIPFPDDPFLNPESYEMAKEIDKESQEEIEFYNDVSDILADGELDREAKKMALESPEERDKNAHHRGRVRIQTRVLKHSNSGNFSENRPREYDDSFDNDSEENMDDAKSQEETEDLGTAFAESEAVNAIISGHTPKGPAQRLLDQFRARRNERKSAERSRAENEAKRLQEQRDQEDDNLSDVDDEEIDSVLLNEEEIEIKSKVWMSINKDYLLEQERKRLRREADAANGIVKPQRKRRKTRVKRESSDTTTAGANAANMLKEKVHSKKINYAAVKELFSK